MDWITGLQKAIDYIEDNLTETIDYEAAASHCFSSSYHFQRIFSILCGFTLGEYIRNRRLSLAGAFQKFHGILPSQAKTNGGNLKSFSRLVLKFSLEGGTIMNCRNLDTYRKSKVTQNSRQYLCREFL